MSNSNWWAVAPMYSGKTTALSTTSTSAVAFTDGGGRYFLCAIGCNAFIQTGTSTVGAAATTSGNFSAVIPSGQALILTLPASVTHFRVITDSGSGTLYWGKVGN